MKREACYVLRVTCYVSRFTFHDVCLALLAGAERIGLTQTFISRVQYLLFNPDRRVAGAAMAGLLLGAAALAALAVALYVFVYTPLKKISPYCTIVGAVPGALPVLVGWSAATGGLELQGWVLFFILFLWQLPHFMAIAWLCREDYKNARLPMVTVLDPGGQTAATQAVVYALALLPVSLAPSLCGLGGAPYAAIALFLEIGRASCRERV